MWGTIMPVVFRDEGYRFFFYSNEGDPLEPLHIHARKGESVAKFWLHPQVGVAEAYAIKPAELRKLIQVTEEHKELIERFWHEHFNL